MVVKKFNLTNRKSRIYFLYKFYLFNFNIAEAKNELHNQYYEYNFSLQEEKTIHFLLKNISKYETTLTEKLPKTWKIERLNSLDRAVLINGIFEIIEAGNKKSIVINEALNYIKKFSNPEITAFINGILNNL